MSMGIFYDHIKTYDSHILILKKELPYKLMFKFAFHKITPPI